MGMLCSVCEKNLVEEEGGNFDSISKLLTELPATWYPQLLRVMVESSYRKGVFRPGGASRLIGNQEAILNVGSYDN